MLRDADEPTDAGLVVRPEAVPMISAQRNVDRNSAVPETKGLRVDATPASEHHLLSGQLSGRLVAGSPRGGVPQPDRLGAQDQRVDGPASSRRPHCDRAV